MLLLHKYLHTLQGVSGLYLIAHLPRLRPPRSDATSSSPAWACCFPIQPGNGVNVFIAQCKTLQQWSPRQHGSSATDFQIESFKNAVLHCCQACSVMPAVYASGTTNCCGRLVATHSQTGCYDRWPTILTLTPRLSG